MRIYAGDRIAAASTAVQSTEFDPMAGDVMKEAGADIATVCAKDRAEALKEHFSHVVTVCDASRERFPVWPFCLNIVHWDLIDPEKVADSGQQKRQVLRGMRDEISKRVRLLIGDILPDAGRENKQWQRAS